jgi:hypothetical protein
MIRKPFSLKIFILAHRLFNFAKLKYDISKEPLIWLLFYWTIMVIIMSFAEDHLLLVEFLIVEINKYLILSC